MSAALDLTENDNIRLTTQIYKPTRSTDSQGGKPPTPYVNVMTEDDSVFEAVRDISARLGRKPQWSHNRLLLIGENLARNRDLNQVLDTFQRDREPRLNSLMLVTVGDAGPYLETKPLMEDTFGQELQKSQTASARNSAKTLKVSLLQFNLWLRGKGRTAMLPVVKSIAGDQTSVSGIALVQNGKMTGWMSAEDTEKMTLLMDEYKEGVIKIPCPDALLVESMQVVEHRVKNKVLSDRSPVRVEIQVEIEGSIDEFKCSKLTTVEDEENFRKRLETMMENDLQQVLEQLQEKHADVLGIGEQIYRTHPGVWKELESDWGAHFADIEFDVRVRTTILHTGMATDPAD